MKRPVMPLISFTEINRDLYSDSRLIHESSGAPSFLPDSTRLLLSFKLPAPPLRPPGLRPDKAGYWRQHWRQTGPSGLAGNTPWFQKRSWKTLYKIRRSLRPQASARGDSRARARLSKPEKNPT